MRLGTKAITTITLATMTLFAGGIAAAVSASPGCSNQYRTCEREQCGIYTDMAIERGMTGHNTAFLAAACLAKCKAKQIRCNMNAMKFSFDKPRHKCMALQCR
ncbi:MAG: hypothetical protein MPJ78_17310 [Hyphomicrobiaceae bacterium]|nr:hypothetical protein [Hyphomicrobiaceae bacterium]